MISKIYSQLLCLPYVEGRYIENKAKVLTFSEIFKYSKALINHTSASN